MKIRTIAFALLIALVFTSLASCSDNDTVPEDASVVLTETGVLVDKTEYEMSKTLPDDIVNMNNMLMNNGIPLLWVKLPTKASSYGYESCDYSSVDAVLEAHFIDTLDLTSLFSDAPENYHYKYGEGFNADGSKRIAFEIVDMLSECYSLLLDGALNEDDGYYKAVTEKGTAPFALEEKTSDKETVVCYNGIELDNVTVKTLRKSSEDGKSLPVPEDHTHYEPAGDIEYGVRIYGGEQSAPHTEIKGTYADTVGILPNDAMSVKLVNKEAEKKVKNHVAPESGVSAIVLHNLDDTSIIASLADTMTKVVALDMRNFDDLTVASLVSENTDCDVCITLIDPAGEHKPFSKGKIENKIYADKTRAVKGSDRHLYITYPAAEHMDAYIKNMLEFKKFCDERGTELLFVQAPFKIQPGVTELPEGYEDHANYDADRFLKGISDGGVRTLDLRETIFDWKPVSEVFYKNDHHWKAESGFWAFGQIVDYMRNELGWTDVDPDGILTDENNYNFDIAEDYFIAHFGQEYAKSYVGADDFAFITPKTFEVNWNLVTDSNGKLSGMKGGFYETVFSQYYLTGDNPRRNRYASYLNADQPHQIFYNESEGIKRSDKRVLMIKDSFANCVNPFLALCFDEYHLLDRRNYKLMTPTDFVKKNDFDLIIILYNPDMYYTSPQMFRLK